MWTPYRHSENIGLSGKDENRSAFSQRAIKIHGPKGTGLLYAGEKVKLHPLILGGGQQNGMRSGTDNVPGAAGMAEAARKIYSTLEENIAHMYRIKEKLAEGLLQMENVVIHGMEPEKGAPHILNASFLGARSEVLLHALEDKGIYVSAGSACSSHKRAASATLTAIGCSKAETESAVRFSFLLNIPQKKKSMRR